MTVMEARNLPSFGEPVLVQEMVLADQWLHRSVNVVGRMDLHDVVNCQAKLVDPKSKAFLTVDTTLVEPFDARVGSLVQFIGEVERQDIASGNTAAVVVRARVVRCCDGLDPIMYEQALKGQRDFLNSRKTR